MCFYSSTLDTLNLPSALDALDQPIGLPPSLLKKAEEVRLEKGPDRIQPVVYKTYKGLNSANEALQALRDRKVYGKAVIEVCSEEQAARAFESHGERLLSNSQSAKL